MRHRNFKDDTKTGEPARSRDECGGHPLTVQMGFKFPAFARGAGSGEADTRSDLRGGFLPELLRISTSTVASPCFGRSQTQCAATDVHRGRLLKIRDTEI